MTAPFTVAALCAALFLSLAGCTHGPTVMGTPKTVVERALAFCDEKTEAAEAQCVRKALVDGHVTLTALAAMIPNCRLGTLCSTEYRTRDRTGLLSVTATDYVADWRVTFDLKKTDATAANVPITVLQV